MEENQEAQTSAKRAPLKGAASAAPKSSGRRISEKARERAEMDAAMIPTNVEEYRRWERAVALLKATATPVEAVVIKTPVKMDPRSTIPTKNPRAHDEGEPAFLPARERPMLDRQGRPVHCATVTISGDDLADQAPGSSGKAFRVGDQVKLTAEAAERLVEQGWVKLL